MGVPLGQQFVDSLHDRGYDALAEVVAIARLAVGGSKDRVIDSRRGTSRLVLRQLFSHQGQQMHFSHAAICLGLSDVKAAVRKVDVAPAQRAYLVGAQAGKEQDGERGLAPGGTRVLPVEICCGRQQRRDVLRRIEDDRCWPRRLQPPSPAHCAVALDVPVLDSRLEDLGRQGEMHVDRACLELALADLLVEVAVDLSDRDLREPVLREELEQVMAEVVVVAAFRARPLPVSTGGPAPQREVGRP